MPNRQLYDESDPAVSEEAFEASAELLEDETAEVERDLATEEIFDTQHGDGHTYNPQQAWEQGLTYTPPTDPPVLPSDDPQGAEVAAGFATSMEESSPDAEELPPDVDNNDVELQNDVYLSLRNNSETTNLTDITVRAHNGLVTLLGTVPTEADAARVEDIVYELAGVDEVQNRLEIA